MSGQPIDSEDLAAVLAGFALSFAAVIMSPHHQTPNEVLEALANELHGLADGMKKRGDADTPALAAIELTSRMLMASEQRG